MLNKVSSEIRHLRQRLSGMWGSIGRSRIVSDETITTTQRGSNESAKIGGCGLSKGKNSVISANNAGAAGRPRPETGDQSNLSSCEGSRKTHHSQKKPILQLQSSVESVPRFSSENDLLADQVVPNDVTPTTVKAPAPRLSSDTGQEVAGAYDTKANVETGDESSCAGKALITPRETEQIREQKTKKKKKSISFVLENRASPWSSSQQSTPFQTTSPRQTPAQRNPNSRNRFGSESPRESLIQPSQPIVDQ